jgi:hypothetical protein
MTAEVRIFDDAGNVVAFYVADAFTPFNWRTNPEKPFSMPIIQDGKQIAEYLLFGYTYQPMIKIKNKETGQ